MGKLSLLVICSSLICTFALAAKGTTSYLCGSEGGEPVKSKLVVKADSGQTLFVCGKVTKAKGHTELSSFKVLVIGISGKKLKQPAFEDSSQTAYRVANSKGSLALQELISDGKNKIPAFETDITCDEKSCKRSAKKCVFEAPANVSPKALAQVQAHISGSQKGKVPSVALIHSLARLAYSGNAEAQKLFQDRGLLSLDGEASDAYFDHQSILNKLKKDGCLSGTQQD